MPLNKDRLKGKIETLLDNEAARTTDPAAARAYFADQLATAIVDEIKELLITYTSGLANSGGAVAGTFGCTIT